MLLPPKASYTLGLDHRAYTDADHPAKITGTTLAGIVAQSPWDTAFTVSCKLLGVYREDISDKPAVRTGTLLESRILDYFGAIPAEEVFEPRSGDHDVWPSDFDDPIFAGHVDGMTADGEIVEVKTTKDITAWENGVPVHYWIQASLYHYFLGTPGNDVVFLVGEVDESTYQEPWAWEPEGHVYAFRVQPHPDIERYIEFARNWYKETVKRSVSAQADMNDPRDTKAWRALEVMNMNEKQLTETLERIRDLQIELDAYKEDLKPIEDELKALKDDLKTAMTTQKLSNLAVDGYVATISNTKRNTADIDALMADGLDKYVKVQYTSRMTFKKV